MQQSRPESNAFVSLDSAEAYEKATSSDMTVLGICIAVSTFLFSSLYNLSFSFLAYHTCLHNSVSLIMCRFLYLGRCLKN